MTFQEVLAQVMDWLQHHKRLSYRALKRQFALDDAYLEDLKDAILFVHPQVVDEDGRGLVWVDPSGATPDPAPVAPPPGQSPAYPGGRTVPPSCWLPAPARRMSCHN